MIFGNAISLNAKTYANVVVVDEEGMGFVEIYLEVVPMTFAVDHVNVVATTGYVDGHDFVSCAVIDDFPMTMLVIVVSKRVFVYVTGYPILCHRWTLMPAWMSSNHYIADWFYRVHHSCCCFHYDPNPILYRYEVHYATEMVQFANNTKKNIER